MDRVINHANQKINKKSPEGFHYLGVKADDEDWFCLNVIDDCVSPDADQLEVCDYGSLSESLSWLICY